MKLRLICLLVGFILIEGLRIWIPLDRLANEIQVLGSISIVYTLVRMEILHHKWHKNKENSSKGGQHVL